MELPGYEKCNKPLKDLSESDVPNFERETSIVPSSVGVVDVSEDVLSGIGSTTRTPIGQQHSLEDALSLDEDSEDATEDEANLPKRESTVPLVLPLGFLIPRSPARLFVHNTALQSAFCRSGNTSPLVTSQNISESKILSWDILPNAQPEPDEKQVLNSTLIKRIENLDQSTEENLSAQPESEVDLDEEREMPDDVHPTLDWEDQITEDQLDGPPVLEIGDISEIAVLANSIQINAEQQKEFKSNEESKELQANVGKDPSKETLSLVIVKNILDMTQPFTTETTNTTEELQQSRITSIDESGKSALLSIKDITDMKTEDLDAKRSGEISRIPIDEEKHTTSSTCITSFGDTQSHLEKVNDTGIKPTIPIEKKQLKPSENESSAGNVESSEKTNDIEVTPISVTEKKHTEPLKVTSSAGDSEILEKTNDSEVKPIFSIEEKQLILLENKSSVGDSESSEKIDDIGVAPISVIEKTAKSLEDTFPVNDVEILGEKNATGITNTKESILESCNLVTTDTAQETNETQASTTKTKEPIVETELNIVVSSSEESLITKLHKTEEFFESKPEHHSNLTEKTKINTLQIPIYEDHPDSGLCELIVQCDSRDETYMMYTSEDEFLSPNSESGGYHTPTVTLLDENEGVLGKSINQIVQLYYGMILVKLSLVVSWQQIYGPFNSILEIFQPLHLKLKTTFIIMD